MKIHNATYSSVETTDIYLTEALLAFPEIKKHLIRTVCDEKNFCLINKVLGYGRAVTESDLKNNDKMFIAANHIDWAIMPRMRVPFTVAAATEGTGVNFGSMTFHFTEGWGAPGMVLMFQDGAGGYTNVILTSIGTAESGGFSYTGKLQTSSAAATFDTNLDPVGRSVGWITVASASCADTTTNTPIVYPAWYRNYNTIMRPSLTVCRSGIQQVTWIEGQEGTRCWLPEEEYQFFVQFLKDFELAGWYGKVTATADGSVGTTDQNGLKIQTGSGVLEQVQNGNTIAYDLTLYTDPANYADFQAFLENTIVNWSIQNNLTDGYELDVWAGIKAFSLLQHVLIQFVEQGRCCLMRDFANSEDSSEVEVGINIKRYMFSGFILNLRKCAIFNDPGVQGYVQAGTSYPLEAYKFIIMPDTTCDGTPLIQVYFRGGCGIEQAFMHKYRPGTVDPLNPNNPYNITNHDGFETQYLTEFVFLVNDPQKILVFNGYWNGGSPN